MAAALVASGARAAEPQFTSASRWPSRAKWRALDKQVGGRLSTTSLPWVDASPETFELLKNPFWNEEQPGALHSTGGYGAWMAAASPYAVRAQQTSDIVAHLGADAGGCFGNTRSLSNRRRRFPGTGGVHGPNDEVVVVLVCRTRHGAVKSFVFPFQAQAEAPHRTVQGRVTAIALLLRLDRRKEAERELDTLTRGTLPELEAKQGEWMQVEVAESEHAIEVSGLQVIDDIDWSAIRSQDEVLTARLRRAVDEIAINARRHGHATTLDVTLFRNETHLVVSCADNGEGPSATLSRGLGSAILDDVCRG